MCARTERPGRNRAKGNDGGSENEEESSTCGNYELIRDKQVVTPDMWIALRPAHKCVEELRGRYENMNSVEFVFPAHMILARGYRLRCLDAKIKEQSQ